MFQSAFDYEKARELRDAGIQRAVDYADSLAPASSPKWSDTAYAYLIEFAKTTKTFTGEAVRSAAEESGMVTTPPDKRAWGGVMRRAVTAGIITRDGFETALDPKVHCNIVTRWRSNVHPA